MSSVTFNFKSKKALVTGAAQGIGRHIALQLASNGASVVALDLDEQLDKLQTLLNESKNIDIVCCDITAKMEEIREKLAPFQPFDYLVNCAGTAIESPFLNFTIDAFDRIMAVNLRGAAVVSQIVAKEMIAHSIVNASIVHISSQSSTKPLLHHTPYSGLDMLAQMMSLELGEYGIRTNCVNPTGVVAETGIGHGYWNTERSNRQMKLTPMGRFAEVDDVANAVLFLLSPISAMTTGWKLPVDGGYLAV